jgi:Fic family protein
MRQYLKSHPWISFSFSFKDARPQLWLALGEAASKIEHLAGVPLRPKVTEWLQRLYLAKGVLATTAIEGNTLSEEQVLAHLEGKLSLPKSQEYLAREIDAIVKACNGICKDLEKHDGTLSAAQICGFNAAVLAGLALETDINPGVFRTKSVVVGSVYRGAPASDCPHLVDRLTEWLNGEEFDAPTSGLETVYGIIKAIIAHLYLAWIHPFDDGNGRTSRLVEFYLLLSAGLPLPAAHLLSNHYNQTRTEYYRQLDRASKSGGNMLPFIEYAVEGLVDGLKEQLATIRLQQWDVTWRNYVYERFRDQDTIVATRRRDLVLELGHIAEATSASKILELTPRLARLYAKKSMRSLLRDLDELETMRLITRQSGSVRAAKEVILAFLPKRKTLRPPELGDQPRVETE